MLIFNPEINNNRTNDKRKNNNNNNVDAFGKHATSMLSVFPVPSENIRSRITCLQGYIKIPET